MNSIQRISKFKSIYSTSSGRIGICGVLKNKNTVFYNNNNKCNNNSIKNIFSSSALSSKTSITSSLMINNNDRYYKLNYTTSNNKALQQQQEQNEKQYHLLINDSIEKFKSGELIAAVEILDDAISLCTNLPNAYLLRADIKSYCSKTFKGTTTYDILEDYEAAIALVPDNQKQYIYYSIVNFLGFALYPNSTLITKYIDKGLEYVTTKDMKTLFLFEKVIHQSHSNDLTEGIMVPAKELLEISQSYGTIGLAFISVMQKNFTQAAQLIQSVIDVEIQKPVVNKYEDQQVYQGHLIVIQDESGFTRIRDKLYDGACTLFDAQTSLAIVYSMEPRLKESYDAYKIAISTAPFGFYFRPIMSSFMLYSENYEQAIEDCNIFFKYDPNGESEFAKMAHRDRGLAYYALGKYDEAYFDLLNFAQHHAGHFYSEAVVADRTDALIALLYLIGDQLNYHKGLDKKKFHIDEITKQMDFTNSLLELTTENSPKQVQQLLIYVKILFMIYHNLGKSIHSHLVKCTPEEKSEINDREALFYFMSLYLNDSLYLNHIDNHSDILFTKEFKCEDDMADLVDFLGQLPYRESKQRPERQDAHKILFETFNKFIELDNKK